jgi:hypothetical protein
MNLNQDNQFQAKIWTGPSKYETGVLTARPFQNHVSRILTQNTAAQWKIKAIQQPVGHKGLRQLTNIRFIHSIPNLMCYEKSFGIVWGTEEYSAVITVYFDI